MILIPLQQNPAWRSYSSIAFFAISFQLLYLFNDIVEHLFTINYSRDMPVIIN